MIKEDKLEFKHLYVFSIVILKYYDKLFKLASTFKILPFFYVPKEVVRQVLTFKVEIQVEVYLSLVFKSVVDIS